MKMRILKIGDIVIRILYAVVLIIQFLAISAMLLLLLISIGMVIVLSLLDYIGFQLVKEGKLDPNLFNEERRGWSFLALGWTRFVADLTTMGLDLAEKVKTVNYLTEKYGN